MKTRHVISIALLALLAACGPPQPVYRTDFQMVPPATDMGKMCANNCLLAQQNCQQASTLQQQNCEQNNQLRYRNAQLQADHDYENYVRDRSREGKQIKKQRSDFIDYFSGGNSCDPSPAMEQCLSSFHMCYSNCGGQVIPHTMCVANCHLIPPPGAMITPAPQMMPAPGQLPPIK